MSWNYRIVRHPPPTDVPEHIAEVAPPEEWYSLREVHYDHDGKPVSMSAKPTTFVSDSGLGIAQSLNRALTSALTHGILDDPWPEVGL